MSDQTKNKKTTALTIPGNQELTEIVKNLPEKIVEGVVQLAEVMKPNPDGFGEMENMYYRPPVIKIKQLMTTQAPSNANPGDIFSGDTGEVFKKPFVVIPIYPYENRAKFVVGNNKPECRSEDCKISIYGDDCSKCLDRPWRGGAKQACNNSINIYAVNEDFSRMFHLQFNGSSAKAGLAIINQARAAGVKLWHRKYSLNVEEASKGTGTYYKFKTSYVEPVDEELHLLGHHYHEQIMEVRNKIKSDIVASIEEKKGKMAELDASSGVDEKSSPKADFADL